MSMEKPDIFVRGMLLGVCGTFILCLLILGLSEPDYKQQALDRGLAAYVLNPKTGEIEFDWKTASCYNSGTLTTGSAYWKTE